MRARDELPQRGQRAQAETTGDQRFPRRYRLRTQEDFRRVLRARCSAADAWMVVYVTRNELPYSRLGLSVSRKVGPAHVRNRWKRWVREAFRRQKPLLPAGIDLIVIARGGPPTNYRQLSASLVRLAHQAVKRWDRR